MNSENNEDIVLVLGDGVDESYVKSIKLAYLKNTGKSIKVNKESSEKASKEIVVGKTGRDVSVKAYRQLSLMNYGDDEVGLVIYSDGTSVALAFDDAKYGVEAALTEAVESFANTCMQGGKLEFNEGVIARRSFNAIE